MIPWLRRHAALATSLVSGASITALVATVAIVSTGYTAQRMDLGDGSVWVANGTQQAVGRANTEVLELNSVVEVAGSDLEVLQSGQTVLVVDRSANTLEVLDPATSTVLDSVALPPDQPEVQLAGGTLMVLERGTGELWITDAASAGTFDAEADSTLSLGTGGVASLAPDGMLFAASPSAGQVYRVNTAVSDAAESSQSLPVQPDAQLAITSVGSRWAVLDLGDDTLYLDGRSVALQVAGTPALQWPSVTGDRVLVGTGAGMLAVPLGGGDPTSVADAGAGTAARPLIVEGCTFAAWSGGTAWRDCPGEAPATLTLDAMPGAASIAFAVNGDRAVLNDRRSGASWAVQRSGELIDNWDELIAADDQQPDEQENDPSLPPEVETVQQPPVAVDDAFGARPGRATVLPVLLNDYDPNGDVLVLSDLTPIDPTVGRIDVIGGGQQIQLTLQPDATGTVRFPYTITDGRGGSDSAEVVVTLRSPDQNSPPQQVRASTATVAPGGRVTSQLLGDWVDPDGDAIYLTSASIAPPDQVTSKPEGAVVFSDSGTGADLKVVNLVVSDGSAEGTGTLAVSVRSVVPIVLDAIPLQVPAGQELTVDPLANARGGNGPLRLVSVPAKPDVTITPSYENGTFRFVSDAIRTHYLEVVLTDGTQTVTGSVRIDVVSPPDANATPITVPKTVFVQTLRNARIDITATDRDPAGGVLLVTGVQNLPPNSGVVAEVLEQRIVRVSLERPLDNGPVTFNYRVSNGLAEAQGVITVVEIPAPASLQPPIANDDTVTVRVGQTIDIPVLANDEHPDGRELTLDPALDQALPANAGLLFASGTVLRYLAPDSPGNFTAVYRVTGPDGQAATAQVRIAVREADPATNNPPVPQTVTARVLAGESVRIRVPLSIDPDGDTVQLLGQSGNPQKGSVTEVTGDTIVYQAGDYSAGTDSFAYTVIDSLGARATGIVRVGIAPRSEGARNPVAIVDEVTVRPGITVSVQVLANDSDPDGSPLRVTSATPNDGVTTAEVAGDLVRITPPDAPGTYGVIYAIENATGGTSQNFVRVTVDPAAPPAYPIAEDAVLTLSDIVDRDRVTVDVLAGVFFADGDPRGLGLSIEPGFGGAARVTSDKRVEVTVARRSQIIPFKVTNPADPGVFSYAFIRVPGTDDALPQLDRRAPALKVTSESRLVIELDDYVLSTGGPVTLTDSSTVQATHANGDSLVVDSNTLAFTSADRYFGPASISFEVRDRQGRTSVLVLPITVTPRENQPPAFGGGVIEFEPGQQRVIDLVRLTNYPYPDDVDELRYTALNPPPTGFSYALDGTRLTLRADASAAKGSTTSITLGVRDSLSEGQAGRIELRVVPSTLPLVRPAADTAIVKRGETTTVDVLANDQATNPFPGEPLTVTAIRGLEGAELPAGVAIQPSADRSRLTVTVGANAVPGDVQLQYQVSDATGDQERLVWGTVTVSVQDRPDPVQNLLPSAFGDRELTMRWTAGQFNNSPITGYTVTTSAGGTVLDTTTCTGTTCRIPTPGNGPGNGVIVSVAAVNAIGTSDPVTLSGPIWSDIIPPAPVGLSAEPLDRGLRLRWNAVSTPNGGSPVDRYVIAVGGLSAEVAPSACSGGVCVWDTTAVGSLGNGVPVSFTVSARNAAISSLSTWNVSEPASGTPAGPPIAQSAPSAAATSDTTVQVGWGGVFNDNGRPISQYTAAVYTGAAPTCSANGTVTANGAQLAAVGGGTSAQFSGLSPTAQYAAVVFAYNGQGCSVTPAAVAFTPPPVLASVAAPLVPNGAVSDFRLDGGSFAGGAALTGDYSVIYRLVGDVSGAEYGAVPLGSLLSGDGQQYGKPIGVQARACYNGGGGPVCQQQFSAVQQLGVPVDPRAANVQFASAGNPLDRSGTFTWTAFPSGPGYTAVEFACGSTDDPGAFQPAGGTLSCQASVAPLQTPSLTMRVTANNGIQYTAAYTDR